MKPLVVLFGTFLLTIMLYQFSTGSVDFSLCGRVAMTAMLLFTSVGHFLYRKGMVRMIPTTVPGREAIVLATGLFEILSAIAILLPQYRGPAGWTLIVFFILILPGNIYAAIHRVDYRDPSGLGPGLSYLWFRVPMQLLLILWVYKSAGLQ